MSTPTITDWYELLKDGLQLFKDHTKAVRENTAATQAALAFRQELASGALTPEAPAAETPEPEAAKPEKKVKKTKEAPAPEPEPETPAAKEAEDEQEEESEDEASIPTDTEITEAVMAHREAAKTAGGTPAFAKKLLEDLRAEYGVQTVKELPQDGSRAKFLAAIKAFPLKEA